MRYLLIAIISSLAIISCDQKEKTPEVIEEKKIDSSATKETHVGDTANLDFWQKKALQGTDFFATGNEPFWSLEMDLEKSMHFKLMDGFDITAPVPEPVIALNTDIKRYHAETDQVILIVFIAKLDCINDMSGEKSGYTVDISIKKRTDKEYKSYKGCGRYLSIKK